MILEGAVKIVATKNLLNKLTKKNKLAFLMNEIGE